MAKSGDEAESRYRPDRNPKRAKLHTTEEEASSDNEKEEDDDVSGAEGVDVADNGRGTKEGCNAAIITNLDVLDCPICFDPLTVPVFQCVNGHIACSSCCTKIRNKCPSCSLPIGYNRCRAIETIIKSAKILCSFGCMEKIRYFDKKIHENSCVCAPCSCPQPGCAFSGSVKRLISHFTAKHNYFGRGGEFRFCEPFHVKLIREENFKILREKRGQLFVLNKREVESLGTLVTVSCIQPSTSKKKFAYKLEAKILGKNVPMVKLESVADNVARRDDNPGMSIYLMVPLEFIRTHSALSLMVSISEATA